MRLTIHGVICEKTQEAKDEVFMSLTWGGRGPFPPAEWTWGPRSMNDGDARRIGYSQDVGQSFTIVAIEWDLRHSNEVGRFGGRDSDPMGRFEEVLEGRGARYRIIYTLAPTNDMGIGCVLRLHMIHCNDAQERTDEPYLAANGATIWGPASMRTGADQNIDKEVKTL